MKNYTNKFTAATLIVASVVLAISGPVAPVNAQSRLLASTQERFTKLKERVTTAIETNIEKLEQSKEKLNASLSVNVGKDGATVSVSSSAGSLSGGVTKEGANISSESQRAGAVSGSIGRDGVSGQAQGANGGAVSSSLSKDGIKLDLSGANGGDAKITVDTDGISGSLSVAGDLKDKLKESNQKAIDKLKDMKEKVESATDIENIEERAKEFDQIFKEIAIANVQATVTKSIDSMTKVLDRLQLTADKLQSQVNKIKECLTGLQDSGVDVDANISGSGVSGSINTSAVSCDDLNVDVNSGDMAASLQEQLDATKSTMKTIRTFLSSTIDLLGELKLNDYTNTLSSFNGITSQVDIVVNLARDVQNNLGNLASSIRKS